MQLNDFVKDVHDNAVDHGWWTEDRTFGEIVALCHSELSEALEEYRAGAPMIYGMTTTGMTENVDEIISGNLKPEGIAVEMADCVIRIMDWFGKEGLDLEAILELKHKYNKLRSWKHGGKQL